MPLVQLLLLLAPYLRQLIEALRDSGTGLPKLLVLAELAKECGGDATEFRTQASQLVPEGTLAKIDSWLKDNPLPTTSTPPTDAPAPTTPAQTSPPVDEKKTGKK